MDKDPYLLQTLSKAIDVINIFETESEPLTIAEIAKKTKMNRTSLFRILYTLRSKGLVEMDLNTGKYRLGMKIVRLSSLVLQRLDIRRLAKSYLEALRDRLQETIHLVVLNEKSAIFIDKMEISGSIFMGSYIGWIAPLYCTASGKLLLSYQDQEYIDDYLQTVSIKPYTHKTIMSKEQLRENIEWIKTVGYSVDDEEMVEGLTCYAAPVFDGKGKIKAAVSVSGPTSRITSNKEKIITELLDTTATISKELSNAPEMSSRWN